jgi:hypothetical protein
LILAEGAAELGHGRKTERFGHDWKILEYCTAGLPGLPMLVHRLLNKPPAMKYAGASFIAVKHIHGPGRTNAKKTIAAVLRARRAGFSGAVILIDRHGYRDTARIGALRSGRDLLEPQDSLPCAVGCAVEAFDAWMVVDRQAVVEADGLPEHCSDHPESLANPKRVADRVFGTSGGAGLGPKYARVAACADLDLLKRACPQGFAPFAEEVERRIAPLVPRGA